jgi:hypothetical protein
MEPKQAKALKNNPVPNAVFKMVLRGFSAYRAMNEH